MSTNKKNFIISLICNLVTLILLVEHLCGLSAALTCMHIWIGMSIIVHICILRDYIPIKHNRKK